MQTAARLEILLPFRNARETLPECLSSIQRQTFSDYRLLAVDDHSEDGSTELLRQRAATDHRICLLSNPGRGLVSALNHGLNLATAPLIARMDADDRMRGRRLQLQIQYLRQHPEVSVLGCATKAFPEQHISDGMREYLRWQNDRATPRQIDDEIFIEAPFAHPSVVFRRQRIIKLGGYRQGLFPEDYDLWLRCRQSGLIMAKLPQTLLDWRDNPRRTSRTDPRCSRDSFDALRAHYLAADHRINESRHRLAFWGAGRNTRKRCNLLIEKGFKPICWIDIDPRKIGNRINEATVHPPQWLANREPRPLVLIYVTNHGARERIAGDLQQMGYQRGKDYLAVG